jgi:hypothetical protein
LLCVAQAAYFLKRQKVALPESKLENEVMFGELSSDSLFDTQAALKPTCLPARLLAHFRRHMLRRLPARTVRVERGLVRASAALAGPLRFAEPLGRPSLLSDLRYSRSSCCCRYLLICRTGGTGRRSLSARFACADEAAHEVASGTPLCNVARVAYRCQRTYTSWTRP